MFVRIDSRQHYLQLGGPREAPAFLLVNALGTDLRIWDEVIARLTIPLRTIRFDLRGHGLTEPGPPPYSIPDLAGDVEQMIETLQVRRVVICGVSVGGMVAQELAARRPLQVEGLILCATGYRIGSPGMWDQRIAAVTEGGLAAVSEGAVSRWFSEEFRARRPDEVAGYRYMLERCTAAGYIGVCAAIRDADLEPVSRGLRCPTLVLSGDRDPATPPEVNRALADAIPGARFECLAGAAHLPCVEQPAAFAAHLESFIREHAYV
jgi:3-oxoadipate enol-lactonase